MPSSETGEITTTPVVDTNILKCGYTTVLEYIKKYYAVIIILIIVLVCIKCDKEGFLSPSGVIARKKLTTRSDTEVDRTWNLEQLEKSVKLLNRRK
jgi:hypothetical protein